MERLESRVLPSLLGIAPQMPLLSYNSTGRIDYAAASGQFDMSATPLAFRLSKTSLPVAVGGPRTLAVHFFVDGSGNLLGGAPGHDLAISGTIDLNGDGAADLSGVLLTGEIKAFGYQNGGTTDAYDFRFAATGGLLTPYYLGSDIGVVASSEHSTFTGSFAADFTGGAKGNVGPIEASNIDPVPEPASLIVWAVAGAGGLLALSRRRARAGETAERDLRLGTED